MGNNQTENKEEKIVIQSKKQRKKFVDSVKDNLQKITICLASVIYITQGLFEIVKKETTIWDIVGNIGMSVVVGLIITTSLNTMGLKDGRKSEEFLRSLKAYGEAKASATKHFPKLSSWCEYKNTHTLEIAKKEIIQDAGLNWKAYKYGYYEEVGTINRLNDDQKEALQEAEECRVAKITYREMLSDLPKKKKINGIEQAFGESEQDFKKRNMYYDFFVKLMLAIIGGLYALSPLLTKENAMEMLAGVIWNTSQIIMWIAFGVIKYNNARSFIIDEYRQTHLVQKTELFNEFVVTMESCPEIIENYDEDVKTDKFIEDFLKKREESLKEKEVLKDEQEVILD